MGGKLGTLFARAGHEVVFSYHCRMQRNGLELFSDGENSLPFMSQWLRLETGRVPWLCPFFWATTRLVPVPIVNN